MTSYISSVASYLPFRKAAPPAEADAKPEADNKDAETTAVAETNKENGEVANPAEVKEDDASELPSNKKTDEVYDPTSQPGLLWRMGSGVVGGVSSTVGYGVGGVKWVAGTGYAATATVVGATVSIPKAVVHKVKDRRKNKKE